MRTRAGRFFQFTFPLAASLILFSFVEQASAVAFTADDASSLIAKREPLLDLAAQVGWAALIGQASELRHTSIPRSEYRTFSGIGAIVCSVEGAQRAATAFLVGGFDIAVTVAHAFEFEGRMAHAHECHYLVYGPLGQIRERIPLSEIHSQWRSERESFGRPDSDLAVIRLSSAARLPQKTLSLTKFAFTGAPVSLIGFSPELGTDPHQRRLRGHVYLRPRNNCVKFAHDVKPRLISSGAPLIDRRDGVVIGIHNYVKEPLTGGVSTCTDRGNAMLLMTDWLEQTLRTEIAENSQLSVGQTGGH
jgi:hypothetical protein